ncbi:MAG: PD40 domain-containing protein [Armatimonadetes bacterium]|nr:PD40 domain-containing protein [Anaerolineae bacterium]
MSTPRTRRYTVLWGIIAFAVIMTGISAVLLTRFFQATQNTAIPTGTPSGEIAFISNRTGTWDVYLLDAAGTLTNLTTEVDSAHDYFASWDFKAERINFISNRGEEELVPTQVQPDGTGLRALGVFDAVTTLFFEGRLDWDPSWSPDGGARVVWSSLRDFNLEIYAANSAGGDPTRLTNTPARDWFAAWSPDGKRIAFTSDRAGNEDIYMMDADGGNLRQITTNPADDIHPSWSLDGESLLFVSERDNALATGTLDQFIVPADGDESAVRTLNAGEVFEGDPLWSADGATLVYVSNRDGQWHVYQRQADGSDTRRLTDGMGDHLFPVWRPGN